ncbi:hypothetical protein [Flavobacterium aquicola]|uniref:Uncharacterized protein n=1 Tax=Flavobacterium aquicola TaxID=1682742 RepID=A0A3E0E3X8_9FLAO|nr:hypothetical protein [Flavobacterium aquicola]REG92997.1 hypothetical protein C8P67_11498 [Flavobacterium aquicola]
MKYYYITDKKNRKSILENGLIANSENEIFLFENKKVVNKRNSISNLMADCIAKNQLFLEEYAMFEINPNGFKTPLENDNVEGVASSICWVLNQSKIDIDFISDLGDFKTDFTPFIIYNT